MYFAIIESTIPKYILVSQSRIMRKHSQLNPTQLRGVLFP